MFYAFIFIIMRHNVLKIASIINILYKQRQNFLPYVKINKIILSNCKKLILSHLNINSMHSKFHRINQILIKKLFNIVFI